MSNVFREKLTDAQVLNKAPPVYEPKRSLSCSQEPATSLYILDQLNSMHTFLSKVPFQCCPHTYA